MSSNSKDNFSDSVDVGKGLAYSEIVNLVKVHWSQQENLIPPFLSSSGWEGKKRQL